MAHLATCLTKPRKYEKHDKIPVNFLCKHVDLHHHVIFTGSYLH